MRKETKEGRVFRRAQAVRAVVKGQRRPQVSDTRQLPSAALRTWGHRGANQGVQGKPRQHILYVYGQLSRPGFSRVTNF